ncbi:dihydrolipoyl dehydrogenase [Thalassotalea euphylliae]|uniref:Dihydrolipoyl dehydrogenase n=2 Tax=Thalassotalea euphylliae TaxID=1655234 RepID=A0A3E0TX08_9GAMM|nr:dihydrolipoyl dehydrogenase [Thalassotalea euphylliae]REL28897.1 dihydrolipoyl dehydrogenase [Thalassotalea euphylliae]
MKRVDIAIIGTGTAGMGAYREALKFTDNIALIEGGEYGTTCARVGCMPSKLLIAPAEARHHTKVFQQFGLDVGVPKVMGSVVMERVKSERDRFVNFVKADINEFASEHRIKAYASFVDDHTLALSNGQFLKADRIVIATGSKAHIPELLKEAQDLLITNDDVFDWDDLPKSVAVFGAGIIGLELGQALHRLGVNVQLFGAGNSVGPLTDPLVKDYAINTFKAEFPFHSASEVNLIKRIDEGVEVTFASAPEAQEQVQVFDYLLAATGRRANVGNLGLENTTLIRDERGIPLYETLSLQCGNSHIFIAGDVNGDLPLLHEASDEGRLAGENAGRYPEVFKRARKVPLGVVFSDPQIATVGKSYAELLQSGDKFVAGDVSFENQGRARVMLVNKGLMRLYGDIESGCLLGAEMIGPRHEHLAHLLAWVIQMRMTVSEVLQMPFYHPVIEEGLRTGLRVLQKEMGMGPQPPLNCIDCGPGA